MKKLADGREYRSMTMAVSETENDGEMIVSGYATTFNQPYVLYEDRGYKLVERIDPNAFDDCDMTDVIMQYDHTGRVYARTRNGTLALETDGIGLKTTANLAGTDAGQQLYQEIRDGYTDKMSFGFCVDEDERKYITDHETGAEICERTITKIKKLYDVSAVSLPANDATSISARMFSDGVIQEREADRLRRENRKKLIRLKLTEV